MLTENWNKSIEEFIAEANKKELEMIMVGGGALNFHGYHRHSADVDFWINQTKINFKRLLAVFQIDIEFITRFSVNKTFEQAFKESEIVEFKENKKIFRWRVLSLEDLIISKVKSGRPKNLLDIQELKKINHI